MKLTFSATDFTTQDSFFFNFADQCDIYRSVKLTEKCINLNSVSMSKDGNKQVVHLQGVTHQLSSCH